MSGQTVYTYVGNDPLNGSDPSGESECTKVYKSPCPQQPAPPATGTHIPGVHTGATGVPAQSAASAKANSRAQSQDAAQSQTTDTAQSQDSSGQTADAAQSQGSSDTTPSAIATSDQSSTPQLGLGLDPRNPSYAAYNPDNSMTNTFDSVEAGHAIEAITTIVIGVGLAPVEVPIGIAFIAISGAYFGGELIGGCLFGDLCGN